MTRISKTKDREVTYTAEYWSDGPHVLEFASIPALERWAWQHQLVPTQAAPERFGVFRARSGAPPAHRSQRRQPTVNRRKKMTNRSQHNHAAVVAAADNPKIVAAYRAAGSHSLRTAGAGMGEIAEMHRRGDYDTARTYQIAGNILGYLPTRNIDWLVADYLGDHASLPAAQLQRELDAMRLISPVSQ